jgi:glutamate synthase (NADPH/NADH) large chain
MTGGTIVILGKIGFNFGAGMTGGKAIVLNTLENFDQYISKTSPAHRKPTELDLLDLQLLIEQHLEKTGSEVAVDLLNRRNEWSKIFTIFGGLNEEDVLEGVVQEQAIKALD